MKRRLLFIGLFVVTFGVQSIHLAHADTPTTQGEGSIVEQIGCDITMPQPNGTTTINRPCQINDFINLFIYLSKWGMSILAVLALLMLVYAGFQFLTAAGRPSKVDEGKRVIIGTIVGTIISLTAYIIINTAFAAIAGTKIVDQNPFGVISTVFDNQANEKNIQGQTRPLVQPFTGAKPGNGTKGGNKPGGLAACRLAGSGWDFSCTVGNMQVHCADPETGDAPIFNVQNKLEAKGCACGGTDGCFGPLTVKCVREYQVANDLPATGMVDATTQSRIDTGGNPCTAASTAVIAKLPATVLSTTDSSGQGCCVVNDGANDLYCVDDVTVRGCEALGGSSTYVNGRCGLAVGTVGKCGFCSNSAIPSSGSCFSYASPYWCANKVDFSLVATQPVFNFGACNGRCASCTNTLKGSF